MTINPETKMREEIAEVDEELANTAMIAARDVLDVQKGDTAVIITNPEKDVYAISLAMYDAIIGLGGKPTLIVQPYKTQLDFAEPATIGALASNPDIAISLSAEKLGKDAKAISEPYKGADGKEYDHVFDFYYGEKKMRSFWSPGITVEMFKKTVPIDYARLRAECQALKSILDKAVEVRITGDGGTDLLIGLRGRKGQCDDGDFRIAGTGGNLPAGEVYISPELGSSNGVIAFDGSISATEGDIIISTPILATVQDNFVVGLSGGEEADRLEAALKSGEDNAGDMLAEGKFTPEQAAEYAKNARNLGELGIGLNRNATIVGNMLEDEKVYSTCHIAIGANYDDDAKALIHLDGLILSPTIMAIMPDGFERKIMTEGELDNSLSL